MANEFRIVRRVEFSETDMAGIMHFSNFFRFMETAEHAFFRSLGLSICPTGGAPRLGWPRVHAACDYRRPLRFEDRVEVRLQVREVKRKTVTYAFVFRKLNARPPEEVARGALIVACATCASGTGALKAVPIPKPIAALLQAAPKARGPGARGKP